MSRISPEDLASLNLMKGAAFDDVVRCAPLWRSLRVASGQVLWPRGQAAGELGVVVDGSMALQVGDLRLKTLSRGAILGEEGAFFHGAAHSADVLASTDSRILTLPSHQLRALREASSTVYEALVRAATMSVVRRVRDASLEIAKAAEHDASAPSRKEVSALVGLWRKLVPGGPKGECPPLPPLLRKQPGLGDASPAAVLGLTTSFTAQAVSEGEVVFLEGERGDAMYLIAQGRIDVLRHVRGGAKRLVTLEAGAQFGCNALVEPGPRTASCVAVEPCWLYRIDAARFRSPPREAGVTWWESVLHNLADQARRSDDNLLEALGQGPVAAEPDSAENATKPSKKRSYTWADGEYDDEADPDTFKALLDASGFRNEGDIHSSELARVEVSFSDEQMRNRRN